MNVLFIILTVITAILMIGIVLVQKSKGGGLSSTFGGGNQVLGVRGTNKFLEKATWTLAILILVFSVCSAYTLPKATSAIRANQAPVATEQPAPQTPAEAAPVTETATETTEATEVATPAPASTEAPAAE